jgi:preprotein translocase subunit YajC
VGNQESLMFVTEAHAQFGGSAGGSDLLIQLLPFILIFVIMYFLIIRPQRQKAQRHRDMVANIRRGDTVVTSGGLIGKVAKIVDDNEMQIEIAEGVKVRAIRGMIADVRAKGEPVKDDG